MNRPVISSGVNTAVSTEGRGERSRCRGLQGFMTWFQNAGHGADAEGFPSEDSEYSMEE